MSAHSIQHGDIDLHSVKHWAITTATKCTAHTQLLSAHNSFNYRQPTLHRQSKAKYTDISTLGIEWSRQYNTSDILNKHTCTIQSECSSHCNPTRSTNACSTYKVCNTNHKFTMEWSMGHSNAFTEMQRYIVWSTSTLQQTNISWRPTLLSNNLPALDCVLINSVPIICIRAMQHAAKQFTAKWKHRGA